MKKTVCLIVLGAAGSAWALGPLGPTTTTMRQGQWEFGALYTYSEQDIEFETGAEVDNAELESVLGRIAVGVATDRVELFGLIGGADSDDFDTDVDLAFGGGLRLTTNSGKELTWGVVAQVVYYDFDVDGGDLNLNDVQIAVGPTWRRDNVMIYGGPLVQILFGKYDANIGGDIDVDNEVYWGAYVGGGVELFEHLMLSVEGQLTTDSQAASAGLSWRF
jgi:hypothetical protein